MQGVFYNVLASPLINSNCSRSLFNQSCHILYYIPENCHRFVGYLEEEAAVTYTHTIEEH